MSLNCNEINVILDELDLPGNFIQEIIQPGFDTIAFYVYKEGTPKTVLVCTANGAVRINETRRKIPKNDKPLRFMEFLRSKIRGAKILSCRQLGLDRIIKMELSHGGEFFNMYIRLWSAAANIILCDKDGNILDTMFRRPKRGEVTGGKFEETSAAVSEEERLAALNKFPVRDFSEIQDSSADSFNKKVDAFYGEHASALSREALLEKARKWYESHRSKQEAALSRLEKKQSDFLNAAQKKHYGDLILTNAHLISANSNFLECTDFETGNPVQIKIDPKKSAQDNAADYYEAYKKERSGAEELKKEISLAKKKIAALEKAYNDMLAEKNPVRIEQMLRRDSAPKQKIKKAHPGLDFTVNGWYILVGRDANENDELLRHHVKGSDMWLHTRDCPGGYVFIKYRAGKTVPLEILLDAGNLAVYYSKARKAKKADLYYTEVKHLRRAKNGPKGLVIPAHERNLSIQLDSERISRLEALQEEQNLL